MKFLVLNRGWLRTNRVTHRFILIDCTYFSMSSNFPSVHESPLKTLHKHLRLNQLWICEDFHCPSFVYSQLLYQFYTGKEKNLNYCKKFPNPRLIKLIKYLWVSEFRITLWWCNLSLPGSWWWLTDQTCEELCKNAVKYLGKTWIVKDAWHSWNTSSVSPKEIQYRNWKVWLHLSWLS